MTNLWKVHCASTWAEQILL